MSQHEASGCHTLNNILSGGIFTSAKNTVLKKMYGGREHINFSPNNATLQTSYGSFILAEPLDFTDKQYVPCALNVPLTGTRSKTSRSRVLGLGEGYVDFGELKEEYSTTSLIPGKRGKEVGRGATAVVKIMCRKGSPRQSRENPYVAVKEFRRREKCETKSEYERKVKSEFTIAVKLTHPNVVKTLRLCHDTGRWSYVMEYCPFGDLYSLIDKNYLKEQDKLCFAKQLLQGVAYLHESGVAHCDIKLENILLSEKGHIKIADFGLCQIFDITHPILPSQHSDKFGNTEEVQKGSYGVYGSLPYMAPEILAENGKPSPQILS
jgi:protein-serine/threonine kinase